MTPKEKSHELLEKYFLIYESFPQNMDAALKEVLEMKEFFNKDIEHISELKYWNEVESEIQLKCREVLNAESQEARADKFNEDIIRS